MNVNNQIKELEKEKNGLLFMIGFTEDYFIKVQFMNQILELEEQIKILKNSEINS